MYRPEELRNLAIKPKINDISLKVLQDYYNRYLVPFVYTYEIIGEENYKEFCLRFDRDKLCHLLGIESIARGHVKYRDLCEYRGLEGWKNIDSEVIDFKKLKSLNKNKFQSVKAKFVYFYLVPDLIEHPLAVRFDKNKVNPPVRIESEILFYSTYDNAVIHLGISKDDGDKFYFPRTFFVEKLGNDKLEDVYIVNQEKITVKKAQRTILL